MCVVCSAADGVVRPWHHVFSCSLAAATIPQWRLFIATTPAHFGDEPRDEHEDVDHDARNQARHGLVLTAVILHSFQNFSFNVIILILAYKFSLQF